MTLYYHILGTRACSWFHEKGDHSRVRLLGHAYNWI